MSSAASPAGSLYGIVCLLYLSFVLLPEHVCNLRCGRVRESGGEGGVVNIPQGVSPLWDFLYGRRGTGRGEEGPPEGSRIGIPQGNPGGYSPGGGELGRDHPLNNVPNGEGT